MHVYLAQSDSQLFGVLCEGRGLLHIKSPRHSQLLDLTLRSHLPLLYVHTFVKPVVFISAASS